jgi:alpha-L-fucosidase
VQFVKEQLREVLTQYGPMVEVWFDGVPHVQTTLRGQRFDWEDLWAYVHGIAPGACVFSEIGPDIRWSGNESGEIGIPNWNAVTRRRLREGGQYGTMLRHGDPRGDAWMPAECDVSIRPGWFFHEHQTGAVKSGQRLLDIYLSSVGRGSTLLLNVPPDRRGLIHERDEQALRDFAALRALRFGANIAAGALVAEAGGWPLGMPKALVDRNPDTFASYAATNGNEVELTFQFPKAARVACLELAEHLPLGQRVQDFDLAAADGDNWTACAAGKTVGYRSLTPFPAVTASRFRLRLRSAATPITLSEVAFYTDATPPPSAREETKKP